MRLRVAQAKTPMIRDKALRLGEHGGRSLTWANWVEETGGDPPTKADELVLQLMSEDAADVTGQFLWTSDGLKAPMTSWS